MVKRRTSAARKRKSAPRKRVYKRSAPRKAPRKAARKMPRNSSKKSAPKVKRVYKKKVAAAKVESKPYEWVNMPGPRYEPPKSEAPKSEYKWVNMPGM